MRGQRSPKTLRKAGLCLLSELKPVKNIPKKNRIMYQEFGSDGKVYCKIQRMTKQEQKCFDDDKRLVKAGKQVWFRYEPFDLLIDFPYNIKIEKDKLGNVTVIISKTKQRYKRSE